VKKASIKKRLEEVGELFATKAERSESQRRGESDLVGSGAFAELEALGLEGEED